MEKKIVANVKKRSGLAGLADLVAEAGKALRVSWLAGCKPLADCVGRKKSTRRTRTTTS